MIFEEIGLTCKDFISSSKDEVLIFCPFIQVASLTKLFSKVPNKLSIVTSWRTADLLSGISELELYPFCKSNNAYLYINQRIHLKVICRDYKDALVGSANITDRGLGFSPNSNHECIVYFDRINLEQRVHLMRILQESVLINDNIYKEFCDKLTEMRKTYVKHEKYPNIEVEDFPNRNFLISALPMSKSIEVLFDYYAHPKLSEKNEEDYSGAAHDLALYQIPSGLSQEEFYSCLKKSFFSQPFIKALKDFITNEKYFGQIKEWIQKTCVDVPVPSRRDLTGNVQVLYEWFAELGKEEYRIDKPHISQHIFRKNY